ncbi:uncharacterized protein LOC112012717 [Quercus suber]|uniref:uncharacterized protein LOC112012717 n=1 Tax=Quercus suber TaxID=58331 RepID=UPI000CE1C1CF|nr:uncharacterized protein LOC112012717 [Quercus suber]
MQFLNGSNEAFSQVRTQILMMEPSPSIDKAFSLVIQEERQRALGFNGSVSVDSTALAVKTQGFNQGGKNKGKGRPVCNHYGKIGHFMEKCYKLVGFPPGYKQKGRVPIANQVTFDGEAGQSEAASQSSSFPFTPEQCQQLLSMLSSHASSSNTQDAIHATNSALSGISCASFQDSINLNLKNSVFTENPSNKTAHNAETWVLDTGATDHIIHSISLFTNITSSISSFVHLPNGEKVLVTHIGTVQLTPTLILENDLTCWRVIGLGKLQNNLYLLQTSRNCKYASEANSVLESVFQSFAHSVSNTSNVNKPYLWHLRLGHVSDDKLQNCYKLLNLVTRQIFISRDVSFHENVFPFISSVTSPQPSFSFPHICPNVAIPVDTMFLDPFVSSLDLPSSTCTPTPVSNQVLDPILPIISDSVVPESFPSYSTVPESVPSDSTNINFAEPDSLSFDHSHIIVPHAFIPSLRRSSRPSKAPAYLQDYKCNTITSTELS